ncbi:DgyrCDS3607 [Dimorphilus gyrociliatus]|uniref:Ribosome assembly factor mrt4 n=1 Tax=Dimorphilus gyrociliatus TaxID=2664684 RepID=A0A7I8VEV5_9ANNE|nr:DgyrCDS3607 [Dimorphilus gyrociliatus]
MPRSKRDRKVSLTQTAKKGTDIKGKLIENIREALDKYERVFTFSVANMRNGLLKDVRLEWKGSKFCFGKNKVMSIALGRVQEEAYKPNVHLISKRLKGQTGLLFTNKTKEDVLKWFTNYSEADYARAGNLAEQTVSLEEGPLEMFPFNMEPELRQLGLPTKLVRGIINLREDYVICKKGEVLTSQQSRLLKHFCYKMAKFQVVIDAMWSNDGYFEEFKNVGCQSKDASSVRLRPTKIDENDDTRTFVAIPQDDIM